MVWIRGGNTFILRRAFAYSGFDILLKENMGNNDFVYAGYSAAICAITPTLRGSEFVDNPYSIPKGYRKEIIWDGVGLIDFNVLPHYRSHHPESEAVEQEVQYCIDNKILFKVLRDGEVMIEEI